MLFNSYIFIFCFLPIVMIGFFSSARISHNIALCWLAFASLFFYGYWNPAYVGLLVASIISNYKMGLWISKAGLRDDSVFKKRLLVLAITGNLLLLIYYKYANFFVANANSLVGSNWNINNIILPLGISFFTFTQIAYLVDTYQGKVKEYRFSHYLLFVTYFPHLIAGPVLHHKQMMPQFNVTTTYRINLENITIGLAFFSMGLAKKVLLADNLAEYASPVFSAVDTGVPVQFFGAWVGALAYTFQLYFDFSGYSDMAIGISKMFGVNLPINFNSPYKSYNVIEFWRRWHISLSQFLREYLYFPLGGNRKGTVRRYTNLIITMVLGGLWHGANWTFVIWGALHGMYLCINHLWRHYFGEAVNNVNKFQKVLTTLLTFVAVVVAWVFFRAESVTTAVSLLKGMMGFNGVSLPMSLAFVDKYISFLNLKITYIGLFSGLDIPQEVTSLFFWFSICFIIIWALPNSQQLLEKYSVENISNRRLISGGVCLGLLFALSLMSFSHISEFLYFQF